MPKILGVNFLAWYFWWRRGVAIALPPTEPRNPETPKCILKSKKKYALLDPLNKWPQKSIIMSTKSVFGELKCPRKDFLDIFIDFWGHFFRGVRNRTLRTLRCTFGVSVFRGSVGGQGDCNGGHEKTSPKLSLKCLPNCLSATSEGFLASFKDRS